MKKFLKELQEDLLNQGYNTYDVQIDDDNTSHQLVVVIDEDKNLNLTVFFLSDLLNLSSSQSDISEIKQEFQESKVDFLQLNIRFPFDFLEKTTPDLARLILMANWSTPIGAFGLNESQKIIYYRHVFESMGNEPSVDLVLEAVNAMAYYAQLRFDSLNLIASGDKSLSTYLSELDEQNKKTEEFPGYDL